jgi:hypothetical protein
VIAEAQITFKMEKWNTYKYTYKMILRASLGLMSF